MLETKRLFLRPLRLEDAGALMELLMPEPVHRFLPLYPPKNLEEARALIRRDYLEDAPGRYRLGLFRKSDGAFLGYVHGAIGEHYDLGYALGADFWGHGYMTEAAETLLKLLRAEGVPYVTATHDQNNPKSGEVMRRLGMHYCYSYREQWQPKDISVVFRMYQLNLCDPGAKTDWGYWNQYPEHWVEPGLAVPIKPRYNEKEYQQNRK